MSSKRQSGLANRLAKLASTEPEAEDGAPVEPTERSLKVAPAPTDSHADDEPDRQEPVEAGAADGTEDVLADPTPDPAAATDVQEDAEPPAGEGSGVEQTAQVLASTASIAPVSADPAPVEPSVEERPAAAPRRRKASTASQPTDQPSTEKTDPAPAAAVDLHHLRETMERGRNQRRWVEDNLPKRSERGTFMRLPIHLLDVLDEYCDRRDLPQQDFVAAVLDSYFRDLGALPPLEQGHHPEEKFFDDLRRQSRSRDY